ncbi:MAG: pyridoxal-phosphate dependent enzyme, partial [Acidimicrobiia bacterium]|nr:pyridoxal-phosphate dependent enzyme [Acidimicrobiia bacterium]NNL28214.1 pyridoxal-phosphate dependent enzyme [Acidimicrobiia bacterium]
MSEYGFYDNIVDEDVLNRAVNRFKERNIKLPTFAQLANPSTISDEVTASLADVGPDDADARNLYRVHWHNDWNRIGRVDVPLYLDLPKAFTGVDARILLAVGDVFPMITAHKVLAAYACLVPRLVAGAFDPSSQRAIWPSTGNYARGGVAISKIMGCRGVAVLPEGMSRERFDWLNEWIESEDDVIRTYGTESNVKEIYDACKELAKDDANVILNQFSEYSNHMGHYAVTGPALERIVQDAGGNLAAFVAASGSAGTLGAGDYLKDQTGCKIVPVEALECPTMLYNGYGEHNIQGIGDKHIPLIHNVMNSDIAIAISDRSTDDLFVMFNSEAGRELLKDKGVAPGLVDDLRHMGYSSICNMLAAIKTAKHLDLGPDDVIVSVATDGANLYQSEIEPITKRDFPGGFDRAAATGVWERHLAGVDTVNLLELSEVDRKRIFNLG